MTIAIIIITVLVSLLAFNNEGLFNSLKFNPWLISQRRQSWRFVSYALLHGGWVHLFVNMFVLYSFGKVVESAFLMWSGTPKGYLYYFMLYLGGVLFANVLDYGRNRENPYYNAVGASGAVAAVLFSAILIIPTSTLIIFPIPIPLPAWLFGILYLVYSVYMGKRGTDNIGHFAHFSGAVFGLVFTLILKPELVNNITGLFR
ncbi:MAG TPA: rhomboid family intramembrane serine protease [Bacteroidales bacterium]|nr:rhomboid family intramembrane serine protease [Bacteroidales bacterium]